MSVFRRIAAGLVVLLALMVSGAGQAAAGGPTSAMLVAPDRGLALGFIYNDPDYSRLERVLRVQGAVSGAADAHAQGELIRVIWYLHDIRAWRVDEIYPKAPGGPWIATRNFGNGGELSEQVTWHKGGGSAVLDVIKSLGVFKHPVVPGVNHVDPQPLPEDEVVPVAEETVAPAATPPAPANGTSEWSWAIPGFLAGALVAAGAAYLLTRQREERMQLIDAD